jgi:SWI/SNF-related matrix-associated actin-dependent regulator 1 of chromatin subfamily A
MVMRYFYRDSAWWHIGFSYDPELVKEVKSFANSGFNPELREWYVPVHITTSAAVQKWLADHNFREERVYTPSKRVVEYQEPPEVITADDVLAACKEVSLKRTPRHYQAEGIAYMINHGNCINGDGCGLGKTGQSIVTVELMDVFPTLVICPASVKYNWKKEWQKWNPARTVGIVESGKKYDESVWNSDVVVINFDILGERSTDKPKVKYKELLKKYWGSCIIDEIHFLKSEKAIRTRMTKKITKHIAHVWGLTGTLTQNRPLELIQPYQILRRFSEIFGDTLAFKFRYCDAKKTMFGFDASGFSNLEELHELLRMAGYIRRDKRDVLTELPPVIEQIVDAPISNAREYHHAKDDLLNYLETIDVEKTSSAANAPHLVMLNTLRTLSIVGKMAFIKSYIQEWLESNEEKQLAVFGVHRELLQELADHFKAPVIQGGVSIENKQRIVDAFAARKHRLLFANIQSAGTGTDGLQTHCSDMIYIELPDRSTDVEQTNARLERMGQKNTITVTYLLSPETIDVEMKETLDGKKMLTDIVNAGHSENELIAMKFFRNRRRNS